MAKGWASTGHNSKKAGGSLRAGGARIALHSGTTSPGR
jgi:hypothetical protein